MGLELLHVGCRGELVALDGAGGAIAVVSAAEEDSVGGGEGELRAVVVG